MMSDPKPANKNKNKKKKKPKAVAPETVPPVVDSVNECPSVVKLPQNANEHTFINEVQVTLAENKEPPKKKSSKKKKAKGEKADSSKFEAVENKNGTCPVADAEQSLLSFSRSGTVELKHLPEITVVAVEPEIPPASAVPAEQPVGDSESSAAAKKKKKKKKKKKSVTGEETANEANSDRKSSDATSDAAPLEPTYVKVPTSGDNVVLVVSHASFGSNCNAESETPAQTSGSQANAGESYTLKSTLGANPFGLSAPQPQVFIHPTESTSETNASSKSVPFVSISPIYPDAPKITGIQETKQEPVKSEMKPKTNEEKKKGKQDPKPDATNQKAKQQVEKKVPQEGQKGAKSADPSNAADDASKGKTTKKEPKPIIVKEKKSNHIHLFAHLPQYKTMAAVTKHLESKSDMHPAVVAVGAQCAEGIISGSTARCIAFIGALKEVVQDYVTPPNKELSRELESKLQECIAFISKCRPLSVSMCNAVKVITRFITDIPANTSDDDAKTILCSQITKFVEEEIILAKKAISKNATDMIVDGDVILTYAYSSIVKDALCAAHAQKKSFRVIVVDSRPKMEGRQMLRCLLKEGISCTYVLISGISYVMKDVTRVIIGAHALQANGYVMSRVGSSQIALVSSSFGVPFLVCCEMYKFCERVHTDSFVYNELGDPESFVNTGTSDASVLENWKDLDKLQLLNLLYDLTPPELVSGVITEKGQLPFTSVPVVLHLRHSGAKEPSKLMSKQ